MKCDKLTLYHSKSLNLPIYVASEVDAAIAELKAENEKLKATPEQIMEEVFDKVLIYPKEMVRLDDAYKLAVALRATRRALWIARAKRAEAEHAHWATIWFCNTKIVLNINKSSVSQDPYKSNTFRNASEWRNMWYDVASKCRAKAEEYK